jgi:hypothetical protein
MWSSIVAVLGTLAGVALAGYYCNGVCSDGWVVSGGVCPRRL